MRRREEEYEEFEDVFCEHNTGKAVLVRRDDWDQKYWIPMSCLSPNSEVQVAGDRGTLIVARWFAEKEGLGEK